MIYICNFMHVHTNLTHRVQFMHELMFQADADQKGMSRRSAVADLGGVGGVQMNPPLKLIIVTLL